MKKEFSINGRKVGFNHSPLVIAEIGINHEGDIDLAIEMADAAIDAGAEIIKHQTHIIEDEMSEEAKSVIPGNTNVSIYDVMKDNLNIKNITIRGVEIHQNDFPYTLDSKDWKQIQIEGLKRGYESRSMR